MSSEGKSRAHRVQAGPRILSAGHQERPLRVVHVVLDLHEGGLERIVTDLAGHAAQFGHEAQVVCLARAGQLAGELDAGQVSVLARQHRLSMLAPLGLSALLRRLHPDVVHLHSGVWFKGAYAARLARARSVVFTDHGRPQPDPLAQRCLDGLGARMTDRVVAVSAPLQQYLADRLRVPRGKLVVIPNGIRMLPGPDAGQVAAARRELVVPADACVIGSVGRLDPVKAYDRLLSVFAELRAREVQGVGGLMLLLVGDGPERGRLERQAQALGLGDAVRFLGWRKDVPPLLALMDVFVLPSNSEGTSLSLLEAMAAGTAIVATAVGGTPDVLGPSGADQLVPPRDIRALVESISSLLADPDRRRAVGRRGRARVEERYSFEAMASAYRALYEQVLGHR